MNKIGILIVFKYIGTESFIITQITINIFIILFN